MSFAADLIRADGDVVVIPLALARKIGLPAAAFLRQAAYLSTIVERNHGWFFLDQEGEGNPNGETIFQRLGSWESALGLGTDAQSAIRKKLIKMQLLEETRKGMVHGKLLYRVNSDAYIQFLASCSSPSPSPSPCSDGQTGNPDCTTGESGLSKPKKPDCTNRKIQDDIYKVNNQVDNQVDKKPPPPLPPKPKKNNSTHAGVEGGGDPNTTSNPTQPAGEVTYTFLEAAGNPAELVAEHTKLTKALGEATAAQAKLAGLAWANTKDIGSAVGLAVTICRAAAQGDVTACKAAKEEVVNSEKAAAAAGYLRLKALHGKKFRTQGGKTARVDGEWIYLDEGSIAGHQALTCLQHIEEGRWQPLA